jgi:hypothetical protein
MTEAKTPLEAIAETAYDGITPTGWLAARQYALRKFTLLS